MHKNKLYLIFLDLTPSKAKEFVIKNPSIFVGHLIPDEIETTLKYLRYTRGHSPHEIIDRPTSILISPITYKNREKVFEECLFKNVQLFLFVRFVSLMNKKLSILKAHDFIHPSSNVQENLIKQLDVPVKIKTLPDDIELNILRREVMNEYLKVKLGMNNEEISHAREIYVRLKHRSLTSIVQVLDVLINEIGFTTKKIIKNGFVIHASADNIRGIVKEIPKIGNSEIKKILLERPKIMMQSYKTIKTTINHIKSFNIAEESIEKCLEVLTLGPDTVYDRLAELNSIKEFQVHFSNPRILKLIHYKNKVRSRLEYLKSLKIRCYSIHLLSASSDAFEKFAYDGLDKTKGVDTLDYLSHVFKVDTMTIRSHLKLHPNWLQAPIVEIKNTYDYLRSLDYTQQEIYDNLVILLYPITRLQPKLNELIAWKEENDENRKISDVEVKNISKTKLLSLCVYFIESEYHYTGDGLFEVQKFDRNQEPIVFTELPKNTCNYRYGLKSKNLEPTQIALE